MGVTLNEKTNKRYAGHLEARSLLFTFLISIHELQLFAKISQSCFISQTSEDKNALIIFLGV